MANTRRTQAQGTRRQAQAQTEQKEFRVDNLPQVTISGIITDIYDGKKYDFITIKVMVNDINYQLFTIRATAKQFDIAIDDVIHANCYMTAYYNRDKKCVEHTLHVTDIDIEIPSN